MYNATSLTPKGDNNEEQKMILAAIGDIHGNLPALEAVLLEIEEEGVQTIVNTGDIVFGHPWSNEVIAALRARNVPSVQGEHDRLTARFQRKRKTFERRLDPKTFDAFRETYESCTSENLEYLAGLPRKLRFTVDGVSVAVCHGTLSSQLTSLEKSDPDAHFQRQREIEPTDIFICGRTHESFSRSVGGTLFVNPGSVGMNEEPGVACYAFVSTEEEPWVVEHRSAAYSLNPNMP